MKRTDKVQGYTERPHGDSAPALDQATRIAPTLHYGKWVRELVIVVLMGGALFSVVGVYGEGGYPPDYKPSRPAEKGDTNVLVRVLAVSTYMNDKLNAAGGPNSPMCYRNCLTVSFNDVLKCTETRSTYATSEGCEQDAAQKIAACNPKCQ